MLLQVCITLTIDSGSPDESELNITPAQAEELLQAIAQAKGVCDSTEYADRCRCLNTTRGGPDQDPNVAHKGIDCC